MLSKIRGNWRLFCEVLLLSIFVVFNGSILARLVPTMQTPNPTTISAANASGQPVQTIQTNFALVATLVSIVVGVMGIVGGLLELLDWLSWRRKHGKSRTPTVTLPQVK